MDILFLAFGGFATSSFIGGLPLKFYVRLLAPYYKFLAAPLNAVN